ncbi:MAG: ABC transporter substrate-binding protein, partial [Lachnospiraceae bacterium]|nr:ABC transporter substrate-binding protein [Lachnospiraceae bacterium]
MSKGKKRFLTLVGVVAVVALIVVLSKLLGGDDNFSEKYEGTNLEASGEFERDDTYAVYLKAHEGSSRPQGDEILVDLARYDTATAENTKILTDYQGEPTVLYQGEGGYTEWKVTIPEAGMYRAYIEYYPVESRGISMERSFLINGELPFSGSDALTFTRRWADAGEVITDNQGNDRRPSQTEKPDWCSAYFTDYMGYNTEPYEYFFEAGVNTIALDAVNEPMAIRKISICPVE